jgi:DNA-directed RNA polymerase subunit L
MDATSFDDIRSVSERKLTFTLKGTSYPYANTLRRAIMTLVPTVAFRSDLASQPSTNPDISVKQNDTNVQPNELLAHRLSLIPIYGVDAKTYDSDRFVFRINVTNENPEARDVFASDIQVLERRKAADMSETLVEVPNRTFFPPNPMTRDTCMIATLPGKRGSATPTLTVDMRATVGTGREHARFIPTSQASYGYTLDENDERRNAYFEKWLIAHKNVEPESLKEDEARRGELEREFKSMEIQRIYKVDERGEPNSFDFMIESVGFMSPRQIVERALEGLLKMCEPYMGLDTGDLPDFISTTQCDAQMTGFDFLFKEQDHTFGNMIQTWLSDNHVEGEEMPQLLFAGYKIPHPLKDEMLLRIGVEDNSELTARQAIAKSARGCHAMFNTWLQMWTGGRASGAPGQQSLLGPAPVRRTIKLGRGASTAGRGGRGSSSAAGGAPGGF